MHNLQKIFDSSVRIVELDPMDKDAVWPMNIEICITRVPIRKRDGFDSEAFTEFSKKLKQHMVHNGIVFLICYAPIEAKSRPFEIANMMTGSGFNHIDNIIIKKSWFPGKRSEVNLVNSHEYVLHFCNGNVWKLDRLPIREYMNMEDEPSCPGNTWDIKTEVGTLPHDKAKILLSCPGNIWEINTGSLDESIPFDLAELLLRMTDALPGSIVFDPNMGNQSTLCASMKLGHSFHLVSTDSILVLNS